MKELNSKNMEKKERQIFERIMKLEDILCCEVQLNFKKETEKKEKKRKEICSTDLQTCVIKKNVMYFLHYSLYHLCSPTLY